MEQGYQVISSDDQGDDLASQGVESIFSTQGSTRSVLPFSSQAANTKKGKTIRYRKRQRVSSAIHPSSCTIRYADQKIRVKLI
jgi:hypothetical protein